MRSKTFTSDIAKEHRQDHESLTLAQTLDVEAASKLLKIHPSTLLAKARAGEIPAAKPGKCWIFIENELLNWLRGLYIYKWQNVGGYQNGDETTCSLKEKIAKTGITSLPSKEKFYTTLLEPATKKKPRK